MTQTKVKSGIDDIPIPDISVYSSTRVPGEIYLSQPDHTDRSREDVIMMSKSQIPSLIEALNRLL